MLYCTKDSQTVTGRLGHDTLAAGGGANVGCGGLPGNPNGGPAPGGGRKPGGGGPAIHGGGGGKYRTAYYNFSDEFTSNLANGTALIQVSLAASTHYDGRVMMWLNEHETALRSRILAELAATSEEDLASIRGKEELQKRLTKAINETLEEREGFGGVDSVYFRSFIVQ